MGERTRDGRGGLLLSWVVSGLSLYLASLLLGSRMEFDGFRSVVLTALAVGVLNFLLGPLLALVTCPLVILTLGLARFLASGFILILASWWMPGFHLESYGWAVLAAFAVAILNGALDRMLDLR